ncbi:hypothetical protein Dimus_029325 [Dionaea muscipula]
MEEERGIGAKVRTLIEKATNSTAPEVDTLLLKAIKNQDGCPLVRIGTPTRRHPNGSHVTFTLSEILIIAKLRILTIGLVVIVRGLTSVKGLEGVELLDTLVTYLWGVHGVNYYGMTKVAEAKGLRHVKAEGKNSEAKGQA